LDPWFKESNSAGKLRQNSYRPSLGSFLFKLFVSTRSITFWLIFANIIFFIVALILGFSVAKPCEETICNQIAIQPTNLIFNGYVWTLITSMFMHSGFAHLIINMFVLFSLGKFCERIIGRKRFFRFYMLSGIFAGLLYVALAYFFGNSVLGEKIFGNASSYAVGASGAIFAIAGLFVILTPYLKFCFIFLPFFSLPAYIMVPLVLLATWLVSASTGMAVGNTAHLGGFLYGVAYGIYLRIKYKRKSRLIRDMFC